MNQKDSKQRELQALRNEACESNKLEYTTWQNIKVITRICNNNSNN